MTDVMVVIVDHFEPSPWDREEGVRKVRQWCNEYERIASRHADSDGVPPQHSWFYRYDYPKFECIQALSESVYRGFGEVEFHLHHGYDTSNSFMMRIHDGIDWFNRAGAMLTAEQTPQKRFAYIAGDWALDNGRRDPSKSGVNNELWILGKFNCYADFTFPAYGVTSQPRMVNEIYYAADTPKPKSYDKGVPVTVGGTASGDLMLVSGPLYVDWARPYIEHAALESFHPYDAIRISYWEKAGVHVRGRPEWLFIKLHTHGMQSWDMFLGAQIDQMFTDLEAHYMRPGCRLHYVTAREAYNIIKAAEAGKDGNAGDYRDFAIAKPANRLIQCNVAYTLCCYGENELKLVLEPGAAEQTSLRFKVFPVRSISGDRISNVRLVSAEGRVTQMEIEGEGECTVDLGGENVIAGVLPLRWTAESAAAGEGSAMYQNVQEASE